MAIGSGKREIGHDATAVDNGYELDKIESTPDSTISCCGQVVPQRTDHDRSDEPQGHHQDVELQLPDEADTPQHSVFTIAQKRYIVFMVAFAGFFSPLSANIYFPALNTLAKDFSVTPARINLTITTYMIFQGLAPTFFGDLADIAGRRPTYIIGFTIYIAACVGIACCKTYASLLVLRCVQSSGSSGTIALASGVVADVSTSSERGVYMGWAMSGPMVAPAIAPVFGGIFAQLLGWRWIFWFLVILATTYLTLFAITFPETGRNIVGNGSIRPQGWNMSVLNYLQARRAASSDKDNLVNQRKLRIPNPLNSLHLILEKDVALLLFFNSIVCCANYDVVASLPHLLEQIYGYDALQIGLCFLPFGAGCLLAPYLSGRLMDWNFRRVAKQVGFEIRKGRAEDLRDFPIEHCRFAIVLPLVLLGSVAMLCYGWVLYVETSLAAPLVFIFIIGLTMTGAFNIMTALLVDLYPQAPATAQAANNLVRCCIGAGATAVIQYMINAMGRGWCFTLLAAIAAGMTPIALVLTQHGPRWREQRRLRMERNSERIQVQAGQRVDGPAVVEGDSKIAVHKESGIT